MLGKRTRVALAVALAAGSVVALPAAHAITYPRVIATIPIEATPSGAAANPTTNRIFVASQGRNTVDVIDGSNNLVPTTIGVASLPFDVAVDSGANKVYVTGGGAVTGEVTVIDGVDNRVVNDIAVPSGAVGIGLNPSRARAYVAATSANGVQAVDTAANLAVGAVIPTGHQPQGVAVNTATNKIYVTDFLDGTLAVIDGVTSTVTTTIDLRRLPSDPNPQPNFLAVDQSRNRVYVAAFAANTVDVIDGVTNSVIDRVAVATNPERVAVLPSLDRAYVSNFGANSAQIIDTASDTVVATLPTGANPTGLAANPATNRIYVANSSSASVSVLAELTDVTPPETTLRSHPLDPTTATDATFTFDATDDLAPVAALHFECRVDAAAFAPCGSPAAVSGLGTGSHTFAVRAIDEAGNIDPTPASFMWMVDIDPPQTVITDSPPAIAHTVTATFAFSGSDNLTPPTGLFFTCQLDGSAWIECGSPLIAHGVSAGSHTFGVRATDALGNTDPTPATYSWEIVDQDVPSASFLTQSGALMADVTTSGPRLFRVQGYGFDDVAGIARVDVHFAPHTQLADLYTGHDVVADFSCRDTTNTNCLWFANPSVLLPGQYDVYATPRDRSGKVGATIGPLPITVL